MHITVILFLSSTEWFNHRTDIQYGFIGVIYPMRGFDEHILRPYSGVVGVVGGCVFQLGITIKI